MPGFMPGIHGFFRDDGKYQWSGPGVLGIPLRHCERSEEIQLSCL
jgi:hypothetical protein